MLNHLNQILTGLLACVAIPVSAGVIAYAGDPRAERILLHNERGICTEKALRAQFATKKGFFIEGCWKVIDRGNIQIVFLDGDFAVVPVSAFKKLEKI